MTLNNLVSVPKTELDKDVEQQIQDTFDLFRGEMESGKVTGVVLILKGHGLDEYTAKFACKSTYIPSMVGWIEKVKNRLLKFIEV